MTNRLVRILLIESTDSLHHLLQDLLGRISHSSFEVDTVDTVHTALAAIRATRYDVCLVSMPPNSSDHLDLLQQVQSLSRPVPVIILAPTDADELTAIQAGAADYLQISDLSPLVLGRAIQYARKHQRTLAALRLAQNAAETATLAKTEFLSIVSHEMRTPINTMIGTAELLIDTELSDEQQAYAATLLKSSQCLGTQIASMTDFSQYKAGHKHLDHVPFEIRKVLDQVIDLFLAQACHKNIALSHQVYREVPTTVIGDPSQIHQLLLHLIGNAIKFTETGEVAVQVMLDEQDDQHILLCFEVSDSGIGIPQEAHQHLFQHFVQVDSSLTRKFSGTGMGLAICKQIVDLMGGSISLDSTPGKGSTFWCTVRLTLPPHPAQLT